MNSRYRLHTALISALAVMGCFAVVLLSSRGAHAVQMQFYDASVELLESKPATGSDWIITLTNKQAIPAGGTITIEPEATYFTIPVAMDYEDCDLSLNGSDVPLAASAGSGAGSAWGVAVTSGTSGSLVLTNNDTDTVAADSAIVIEIGTIATYGVTGAEQIVNPAKVNPIGSGDVWSVDITSADGSSVIIDTIELLVATIEHVEEYAGQKPHMTFEISGITPPDGGVIAPNLIEWREITPGVAKTAVMRAKVNTDAQNGFTVYIKQDTNMLHAVDPTIDIDPIKNVAVGTNDAPVDWTSPTGTTLGVDTGFLGYTTSDTTLNTVGDGPNRFATATKYAGFTTTSEEILYHHEATQSDIEGQDYTNITLQLEVNNLQPSGNYAHELIFIAKPVF